MPETRARLIGINPIALEVGDVDAALEFYGSVFGFELRGRHGGRVAFLDAGDQFVALSLPGNATAEASCSCRGRINRPDPQQARVERGEVRSAVDLFMAWMRKPTRPARMPASPCSPRGSTVSWAGVS